MDKKRKRKNTEKASYFKKFRQIPEMKRKTCLKLKGLKQKNNIETTVELGYNVIKGT
jgi:hypothetical protein